jgi:hypothetical protein
VSLVDPVPELPVALVSLPPVFVMSVPLAPAAAVVPVVLELPAAPAPLDVPVEPVPNAPVSALLPEK